MKQKLQKFAAKAATWGPDALMVGGAAGVSYGAGLVYVPAGWIVAGLFSLVAGWMAARSAK
ncbi:hypothetical protein [uncultured Ramlibacter sp.]|uniref:hypothetical protein n=1 Tax=uncultured Ramlibacter sp. TaxID=260755 RepID=UPI00260E35F4|nr:hypothetical protein [uncultured Ramlibacter sp.]